MSPPSTKKDATPVDGWGLSLLLVLSPPSPTALKNKPKLKKSIFFKPLALISISFIFTTFCIFSLLKPSPSPTLHSRKLSHQNFKRKPRLNTPPAFQGMGTLFRKGSAAMEELVVAHLPEDTTHQNLRFFTNSLHRSGVTSKSDVVFLYGDSFSSSSWLRRVIQEEDVYFFQHVHHTNKTFDFNGKGRRRRGVFWGEKGEMDGGDFSYGSLVGFSTSELEPENTLAGLLRREPATSMRRWACYTLLLGRLRRRYKRILLLDVKKTVAKRGAFVPVRNHGGADFVILMHSEKGDRILKNDYGGGRRRTVGAAVIVGGERGVRRLAKYMAAGVAAAAAAAEGRKEVEEGEVLSRLVESGLMTGRVDVFVAEVTAASGFNQNLSSC